MLGLLGPKSGKIGAYRAASVYQGLFKKGLSTGSRVINEVVLGTWVNKSTKSPVLLGARLGPGSLLHSPLASVRDASLAASNYSRMCNSWTSRRSSTRRSR